MTKRERTRYNADKMRRCRERREAEGLSLHTVYLSAAATATLEQLTQAHGSKREAIEQAISQATKRPIAQTE